MIKTENNRTKETATLKITPRWALKSLAPPFWTPTPRLRWRWGPFWPCRPPVLDTSSPGLVEDTCASACHTFPCNWSCHCITSQCHHPINKIKREIETLREKREIAWLGVIFKAECQRGGEQGRTWDRKHKNKVIGPVWTMPFRKTVLPMHFLREDRRGLKVGIWWIIALCWQYIQYVNAFW